MTGPSGVTTTLVRFGGDLTGEFKSIVGNGGGQAFLQLNVNNNPFSFGFNGPQNGTSIVDAELYTNWVEVPVGQPFSVLASLTINAQVDLNFGGEYKTDFGSSFLFDPNAVFDLQSGFTANSASWGLVDNSLASASPVPEPSSLILLGLGSLGLLAYHSRRSRKRVLPCLRQPRHSCGGGSQQE